MDAMSAILSNTRHQNRARCRRRSACGFHRRRDVEAGDQRVAQRRRDRDCLPGRCGFDDGLGHFLDKERNTVAAREDLVAEPGGELVSAGDGGDQRTGRHRV